MYFGVDYYPEHWDKSEWGEHIKLMKKANFNIVRIAEFAWGRLEPREGEFDFSWLDEIMEKLHEAGIKVILGTPTAAPPKWLVNKYDVLMRDRYGRKRGYGSRRECCSNSPDYRRRADIITEKMAERYGKHPAVAAWQIDNEFGCHASTRCYCENCRREFASALSKKYGSIGELNRRWGTVFWSQEYEDFDDVILPGYTSCEPENAQQWSHNPSLDMEFYRFSSDSWVRFEKSQADIIRKYSDRPITHNFMGHFSDIDYYKLAEPLDFVSWDNYVDNQWNHETYENSAMAHEIMRGAKNKNFWVMEEQAGPAGWDKFGGTPRPGQIRLWTYQAIAHGCDGMVYFRFKSAPFGMEQYWLGVIDYDGIPRRRYFEIQKTGEEIKRLASKFEGAVSETDVLIVKSYENTWSSKIKRNTENFDYRGILYDYYAANLAVGTDPACGPITAVSGGCKAVYAPAYSIVTDEEARILEDYVSNGGTLVLTYRSGIRDEDNNMLRTTPPGALRLLTGIRLEEFDSSPVEVGVSDGFGRSRVWRDIINTETAHAIAVYEDEFYKGSPAVTVNTFGKGRVIYVACDLSGEGLLKLVRYITEQSGARYIEHPEGTEVIRRRAADGSEYTMLLNHNDKSVKTELRGVSLFDGSEFDGTLEPYGVEIIE